MRLPSLNRLKPHPLPFWTTPLALLVLCAVVYAWRGLRLGFFWDDWPYMWFLHALGPQGMSAVFGGDRPFLGVTYTLTTSLLGTNPAAWQLFAFLARWLCGVSLWWLLVELFPARRMLAVLAALLFTVYPGFSQQWIAVIYGHAFLIFVVFFASLALMVKAARQKGWRQHMLNAAGLLCAAYAMFSTEYFFGLEALRPLLLWLTAHSPLQDTPHPVVTTAVVSDQPERLPALLQNPTHPVVTTAAVSDQPKRLPSLLQDPTHRVVATPIVSSWIPYLLLAGAFVFWRTFVHRFPGRELLTDSPEAPFIQTLPGMLVAIFFDLVDTLFTAWRFPLQFDLLFPENSPEGLRYVGLLALIVLAAAGFLFWLKTDPADRPAQPETRQALMVGGLALLTGGAPFWITSLSLRMGFPWDRYTLPLSMGAAICTAGLIDLLLRSRAQKIWLAALLVGIAGAYQANLAVLYKQEWSSVTAFAWQLTWRAPGLQPGTLLLMEQAKFAFNEDDSLAALVNWIYAPTWSGGGTPSKMPYMVFSISERLNKSLPALQAEMPVYKDFRAAYFEGSTSQALVLHYAPPGCLQILDPRSENWQSDYPDMLLRALPLSNLSVIAPRPLATALPPVEVFGTEPKHRWCFYYEQAELSRQTKEWDKIILLGREAFSQGYYPFAAVEYLPFIEGNARQRYWDDAYQITQKAYQQDAALRPALCNLWERLVGEIPGDPSLERSLAKLLVEPGCHLP